MDSEDNSIMNFDDDDYNIENDEDYDCNSDKRELHTLLRLILFYIKLLRHYWYSCPLLFTYWLTLWVPVTLPGCIKAIRVDNCIQKVKYAVCPNRELFELRKLEELP